MRSNYWSSGNLANWIRTTFAGTTKPIALPLGEWKKWDNAMKSAHPFVFWLTEVFLDQVQNIINKPNDILKDMRYWGYNRFVGKPHVLDTKLPSGQYYDLDTRILHGLFESLVDFVEIEKAHMMVTWNEADRAKYNVPWYKRLPYFLRWKPWRCPEAGIDHLKWEMYLVNDGEWLSADDQCGKPTLQAVTAAEQYELYNWWKNVRPFRLDAHDVGGWTAYSKLIEDRHGEDGWLSDRTDEEQSLSSDALKTTASVEAEYEEEDEMMLIRLIKIRRSLWT